MIYYMKPESFKPIKNRIDAERNKKIKDILLKLSARGDYEYMDEIAEFSRNLEKKYSDARKHMIFHDLIGSGLPATFEATYDDCPGEDSVEEFVNDLSKKYK